MNNYPKSISGWTCGWCLSDDGYPQFFKSVNATKALCHVLKAQIVQPLIVKMESEEDANKKKNWGIVDLVFFDGASNVQIAGVILQTMNPHITLCHGAEHVVSLFFSDVYRKVMQFHMLSNFCKQCRSIWGAVRHTPLAIFKQHTKQHNNGCHIGFIKPSECRMAGEHTALLCLFHLKNALRATITSK